MTTPIGLVEALATEARTLIGRPMSGEEFTAYVARVHRMCGHWTEAETTAAFDGWMEQIDPDRNPPRVLPPVRTLGQIRDRAKPKTRQQEHTWHRPRREFVKAHTEFREFMRRAGFSRTGLLDQHDHHRGAAGCPVCGPAGDERRAEVEARLEALPLPVEAPTESCRCDGGWEAVRGGVRPCRSCLPAGFAAWVDGEYT